MARLLLLITPVLLLLLVTTTSTVKSQEVPALLNCFYENGVVECVKKTTDETLVKIESEITGRKSPVTFSKVFDEAGSIIIHGIDTVDNGTDDEDDSGSQSSTAREARKKKLGKKKKFLLKLIPILMAVKAKISLILQFISTHFQLKFFAIAVVSLIINFVRLWLEIKRGHAPAKVIYYEHAQHQHHYEGDDDHGYWKRRSIGEEEAQQLAYSAWQPKQHR